MRKNYAYSMHLAELLRRLRFFYSYNKNKLPIVEFNGAVYACLYNHRDNIIALVDNTGTQVVSYFYDALENH